MRERRGGGSCVWQLPGFLGPILVGAWHTHHHPYTVVNGPKLSLTNTPTAQMVVQQQTKIVKQFE